MFKKLLSVLGTGLLLSTGASAQVFTLTPNDTIEVTTTGQGTLSQEGFANTLDIHGNINNISGATQMFKWQLLSDSTEHPAGWVLTGICDNVQCRTPYSGFYYGEVQETLPVAVAGESLLEARIYCPVASANGTGVFRVKVWSVDGENNPTQEDTMTFIVHKNPTAIASIAQNDNRVKTFPNPAQTLLNVYTEKSLSASRISVVDITGKMQLETAANTAGTTTSLNIQSLAKGTYLISITDANGRLITTRKFAKN